MTNFASGDLVTINCPGVPKMHGKKGKIVMAKGDGAFIVEICDGKEVYPVDVLPRQMVKVVIDSAFGAYRAKLSAEPQQPAAETFDLIDLNPAPVKPLGDPLPPLRIPYAELERDSQGKATPGQLNFYINAYNDGMREGYLTGYSDAMDYVLKAFSINNRGKT